MGAYRTIGGLKLGNPLLLITGEPGARCGTTWLRLARFLVGGFGCFIATLPG